MQKQIDKIERDVQEMKNFLLGDEYNENGLKNRVKKIEDYQSKDKKQKYMIIGGATVLGLIGKFWDKLTHIF
jgi:hypothetical protein